MERRPWTFATLTLGILLPLSGASNLSPDPIRGQALFAKRCTGCHDLDHTKAGPPIRGAFGRPAARDAQFPYSDSLRHAGLTWDEVTLEKWLADPDALVPGNDMSFRLDDRKERADIIAYLKQLPAKKSD